MNKVLSFLKGVVTLPATWVVLAVAAPFYENCQLTVIGTTLLCGILGRSFGKWEFQNEEINSLRKAKMPIRKVWLSRFLSLITFVLAFAGIWFSVFFMIYTPNMSIKGDQFLAFSWLLLIIGSANFFVVTQSRYNGWKRWISAFYLAVVLVLMYINYKSNYPSFHLMFS